MSSSNRVLEIPLQAVRPDPDQVRRQLDDGAGLTQLKTSIRAIGQLHPIRVRRACDGRGFVIVDGERRWRALCQLDEEARDEDPQLTRYGIVRAIQGEGLDEGRRGRIAIQIASNAGEPLSLLDRIEALKRFEEIEDEDPRSDEELKAALLGMSNGQIRHLRELAQAPAFIVALAAPGADGEEPLSMSTLRTLHLAYKRLSAWDDERKSEEPDHEPVAESVVKKIGDEARKEGYSRRTLEMICTRAVQRIVGSHPGKKRAKRRRPSFEKRARAMFEALTDSGILDIDRERRRALALQFRSVAQQLEAPDANPRVPRSKRGARER